MSNKRCILERWHQTCHILVSSMHIFFTVHSHITLFRQDLNSSVMTGSKRVVDHTSFSELHWARDPFSPNFFILPPGFQAISHMFDQEFIEVLKDVHALKCIRDNSRIGKGDVVGMARIDNHQASIQSRLAGLQTRSPILECCRLAAYLCSTSLRCKIWPASTIPVSHLHCCPHLARIRLR